MRKKERETVFIRSSKRMVSFTHDEFKNKSSLLASYLGPIQVVRLHVCWLVSLRLLGEGNGCAHKT